MGSSNTFCLAFFLSLSDLLYQLIFGCRGFVCLCVSTGVRGKPRMYLSLAGLLYSLLWTFQLWPPDSSAPTDASYRRVPHSSGGSWNLWAGNEDRKFSLNADFHATLRDLLHAANLRHGTHGFTSLPKEGVLRIFPPLKIRRLRPGLNPRTWVTEASTLTPRPPKPLCRRLLLHLITVGDTDHIPYDS
jgi:hypothetical protein